MRKELPTALRELAEVQQGIIAVRQALKAGVSKDMLRARVDYGRWQRPYRGVYATFTGALDRRASLWAAVLYAGPDAMLSHGTAAELDGLADRPSPLIHVTVPAPRQVQAIPGIIIHQSNRAERARHPARTPPRTRLEETVLDLADTEASFEDVFGWVARAVGRRLTTRDRLQQALDQRSKGRWRAELREVLGAGWDGVHSPLERRYLREVERPHRLPASKRQVRNQADGRTRYLDVLYQDWGLVVELDGRVAHPGDTRWADIQRDNSALVHGMSTLRYGWIDVTVRPCEVAAQVAQVLAVRGWPGTPRPCAPGCAVGKVTARRLA